MISPWCLDCEVDVLAVDLREMPVVVREGGRVALVQASEHVRIQPGFAASMKRLCGLASWTGEGLTAALAFLELDFTLALLDLEAGGASFAAGHRSSKQWFWQLAGNTLQLRDSLPRPESRADALARLDERRLHSFIASGWATGPFEYSDSPHSIDRDWMRIPSGMHMQLGARGRDISLAAFDNIFSDLDEVGTAVDAAQALRDAVTDHLTRLAGTGPLCSEFSGGIDSGIAIVSARRELPDHFIAGLACQYPYSEFQREALYRDAIATHAGIDTRALAPEGFLPFSSLDTVPPHDEPTLVSTSWCQFQSSTRTAASLGARVVLTGHGGDTLFRFGPDMPLSAHIHADAATWFPRELANHIGEQAHHIAAHLNGVSAQAMGGWWHPAMFDPGLPARFVASAGIDVNLVSGLVSRDTLRAAARLWRTCPVLATNVQKPFAHHVFGDLLPDLVWARAGKVDHLGTVYRGVRQAGPALARLIDDNAACLAGLGVTASALHRFLRGAVRGEDSGNPVFSQLLAILIWLDQFQAGRPSPPPAQYRARWSAAREDSGAIERGAQPRAFFKEEDSKRPNE